MSNIDLQKQIAELELTVQGLVAERDALKARIEEAENREPVGCVTHRTVLVNGRRFAVAYVLEELKLDTPLYTKSIPSPDTAELIRREIEEAEPVAYIERDELELELLGHRGELYGSLVFKKPLLDQVKPEYQEPMQNPIPLYRAPPDTAELIRKAREEERENILNSYAVFKNELKWLADAIRSRKDTKNEN